MSTSRAKAAATASTASRAGVAAAATMFETHQARQETSVPGGVLMTVVFLAGCGNKHAMRLISFSGSVKHGFGGRFQAFGAAA